MHLCCRCMEDLVSTTQYVSWSLHNKVSFETQNSEKVNWETRVEKLEKEILDLNSELEDAQKINEEQKKQIRKTECALKVVEGVVNYVQGVNCLEVCI
ncbi:hypothetical protein TSUD_137270 [Trifolium subterraneum]|uniref:Uncharacterized protein n=1 Tax=Trifolium subterraneum TaxID=3900 RepID=A0A2Z6P980_TRISU|nr:hypothetical protein TSUD_137270 [Trifolium subterraneum]